MVWITWIVLCSFFFDPLRYLFSNPSLLHSPVCTGRIYKNWSSCHYSSSTSSQLGILYHNLPYSDKFSWHNFENIFVSYLVNYAEVCFSVVFILSSHCAGLALSSGVQSLWQIGLFSLLTASPWERKSKGKNLPTRNIPITQLPLLP